MILTGNEIEKQFDAGKIKFSKFEKKLLGTNSYDLRLGDKLIQYTGKVLDPKKKNAHKIIEIPHEGYVLPADSFVLGSTSIKFGSDYFVPIIHGRSSAARLGVFIHISANLFDIGYYGKSTLQIHNLLSIVLYPCMPIAQVSFWKPYGKIDLYKGKYQNSDAPVASKIHQDSMLLSKRRSK